MTENALDRLPEVYGSPHQLVATDRGYALVDRDTGEAVALQSAPAEWLAAWWAAWKAQAQIAVAALAAVEREMVDRCDRAGVRTLHADDWTIVRTSPKPPKWDAPAVRGLLEMAADKDLIDQAALDNAVPLRPVPQQGPLKILMSTLPEEWATALKVLMEPGADEPRIKSASRG